MLNSSNIQDVGGSGAIRRMQLNACQPALCRWATATIYLEACSTYTFACPVPLLPSPTYLTFHPVTPGDFDSNNKASTAALELRG
jgi:hypothetical protein